MKKLTHARWLLSQIELEINGIKFTSIDDRNRVSGALFDIVLDHAKAIIILFDNQIYPSAYALARPLFEGFVRASWLLHCATDADIEFLIKKDKFKHSFGEMLECVEKELGWPKALSKAKGNAWNAMHSYTHGGLNQISRRITFSAIEPVIDEEELEELICFLELVIFLTFTAIIRMSGSTEKDGVIEKLAKSVMAECFN